MPVTDKPTPTHLAIQNRHPRDKDISFEEGPHIYTVLGERGTYTSVTTMIHRLFSHFDADEVIDKMMRSKNWNDPNYKYYGMSRDQIKALWNSKRDQSAGAGTNMHYDIECYWNGLTVQNESIEFQYFKEFVKDFPDLKPYRTEWMVYHEDVKLSGSIDMVFENPDGTLQIYDWKRCQEIKYDNDFGKNAIAKCIQHIPDTNFWHYSLQLNTYKKILEDKYGKQISDMYLICIHPENAYKRYDRIQVPVLEKELENLFSMLKDKKHVKI
jgi:ATP-dependent exoDNAse (exonuclease V) beta subunit